MKLKTTYLLLLFLFTFSTAKAQLKKGDYFLDNNGSAGYYLKKPHEWYQLEFSGGISYKKMISNHWMLGGRFSFSRGSFRSFSPSNVSVNTYHNLNLSFDIRRYFRTNRWAPFLYLHTDYFQSNFKNITIVVGSTPPVGRPPSRLNDGTSLSPSLVLGLTFSLAII